MQELFFQGGAVEVVAQGVDLFAQAFGFIGGGVFHPLLHAVPRHCHGRKQQGDGGAEKEFGRVHARKMVGAAPAVNVATQESPGVAQKPLTNGLRGGLVRRALGGGG